MEPVVLAHMGGIDEIAGVLVPLIGVIILLRAGAKRRAQESEQPEEPEEPPEDPPSSESRG